MRCGHGGRHQSCSAPFKMRPYRRFKRFGSSVHKVRAAAAVNMNVNKAGENIPALNVYTLFTTVLCAYFKNNFVPYQ